MNWLIDEILPIGIRVHCSLDYWEKITEIKHPSMKTNFDKVKSTLQHPDVIRSSSHLANRILIYKHFENSNLCVVVRVDGNTGLVLNCYFTDKIKEGSVIWTK